jgi:hypothetical protein
MSIEKLSDDSQSRREQSPFAQILNEVIEHIKDNDAFRIYSYLCSKDRNWKVIKEWTAQVCGVGEKKARQCWSYLARCGLIQYVETRDEKGKILKHDVHVLVGHYFNKDEPFLNKKEIVVSTEAKTAPVEVIHRQTHRGKKRLSGETTRVDFAPLLNKDLTNKDLKQNKDKSFCVSRNEKPKADHKSKPSPQAAPMKEANSVKHDWAQMKNEAAHIEQHEARKKMVVPPAFKEMITKMKQKMMTS